MSRASANVALFERVMVRLQDEVSTSTRASPTISPAIAGSRASSTHPHRLLMLEALSFTGTGTVSDDSSGAVSALMYLGALGVGIYVYWVGYNEAWYSWQYDVPLAACRFLRSRTTAFL
jgi:hypothetical protein